jgi:hypothetical protein
MDLSDWPRDRSSQIEQVSIWLYTYLAPPIAIPKLKEISEITKITR